MGVSVIFQRFFGQVIALLVPFLNFFTKMRHPLGYNPGQNILPLLRQLIDKKLSNTTLCSGFLNQTLTQYMYLMHSQCSLLSVTITFIPNFSGHCSTPPPPSYNVGIESVVLICTLIRGCVLETKPTFNPNIVRGGRGRARECIDFCEVATIFCPRLYPKINK